MSTQFTCFVLTKPENHREYLRPQLIVCGEDVFEKKKKKRSCVRKHIKHARV